MKAKLGFFCYFLAVIFVIWALPIKENSLSNQQQVQLLLGFRTTDTDAYQVLCTIIYYCFDYLSLMIPLQGLLNLNSFLTLRSHLLSLPHRFGLYFKYFYPYFLAFSLVKALGLALAPNWLVVIKILVFLGLWWVLLLVLSQKQINRSYSTAIVFLAFTIFRFLVTSF